MYGYIYKTTNLIDGKIYVGQKRSKQFLGNKYLGSGKILKRAVAKHGKENFSVELIEEVESEDLMDEREIYWIDYFNATSLDVGYNISSGGLVNRTMKGERNPSYGKKFSEERKQNISNALKAAVVEGRWHQPSKNPETAKKISKSLTGHEVSEEAKEKLRYYNTHKVCITDGVVNKTVLPEFLEEWQEKGFYIGTTKKPRPKKRWVNNGIDQKCVSEDEVDYYINSLGYTRGYLPRERDSLGRFVKKENVENPTEQVNDNEQQK